VWSLFWPTPLLTVCAEHCWCLLTGLNDVTVLAFPPNHGSDYAFSIADPRSRCGRCSVFCPTLFFQALTAAHFFFSPYPAPKCITESFRVIHGPLFRKSRQASTLALRCLYLFRLSDALYSISRCTVG
jgi:hypothetical protein